MQYHQFLESHPQKHTYTLHKYNIPCIPIIQGYKIPSPKDEPENYAHVICVLFTPWKTYTNIKKSINTLWMQNLNSCLPKKFIF
jgi:hypothetical protein